MHLNNLYKSQEILMFKRCYALCKVHGTSAHLSYKFETNELLFSPGGEKLSNFMVIFDIPALTERFRSVGRDFIVYGEAYGGKCQGMSSTYGDTLRFIAFDVKMGDVFMNVPMADAFVQSMGLEFVPYKEIDATLEAINAERDADSEVAIRRGCGPGKKREGVVLRPLIELRSNNDERIMSKHKRDDYQERATPQKIIDPDKLKVLADAQAIADEWVVEERLSHVLQRIPEPHDLSQIPLVIETMKEDVLREAKGEIVESKEALKAIGAKTAKLFRGRVKTIKL